MAHIVAMHSGLKYRCGLRCPAKGFTNGPADLLTHFLDCHPIYDPWQNVPVCTHKTAPFKEEIKITNTILINT